MPKEISAKVAKSLQNTFYGTPMDIETLVEAIDKYGLNKAWLLSKNYWNIVVDYYIKSQPKEEFINFFWAILGLHLVLFDVIKSLHNVTQCDVYHAVSVGYAGLIGAFAKVRYNSPLVITEQGFYLLERKRELQNAKFSDWYKQQIMLFSESIVKTSYKYANRVVPPSHLHIPVETGLGLPLEKIEVINNGIECEQFYPGPPRANGLPVVGLFARVVPIKGIELLVDAASIVLEKHNAEFLVIGQVQDEEYYQHCLKLVEEAGISDHFKFLGHQNSLDWYHKVDIFTLSSLSEGVPYSLLEAMSCGLPSVCTAVGGVPEIIEEGLGYVVPSGATQMLAEKLALLIANKELRKEIGNRATQQANAKYNIRGMADRFLELYDTAIEEQTAAH
jgi:glycosyltransferase involved in cell wall biosynthesis